MSASKSLLLCGILLLSIGMPAQDTLTQTTLGNPNAADFEPAYRRAGRVTSQGGYLLAVKPVGYPGIANIFVYDKDGSVLLEGGVTLPEQDIDRVLLYDETIAGQTIFVSGVVFRSNGQFSSFIASIGFDGKTRRVLRTHPFGPFEICSSDGETVWAYGADRDIDMIGDPDASYPMLRHYSLSKGLMKAALPKSTFTDKTLDPRANVGLQCSDSAIRLLHGLSGQWITYQPDTNRLSVWKVPPITYDALLSGFAVTNAGDVFISRYDYLTNESSILRLDLDDQQRSGAWSVLSNTTRNTMIDNTYVVLTGSTGTDLLYRDVVDGKTLHQRWAPLPTK